MLAAAVALAWGLVPAGTAAADPAHEPPFGPEPPPTLTPVRALDRPPPGFALSGADVVAIADGTATVRDERAESPGMRPWVATRSDGRWQVDYRADGAAVAEVVIDDPSGVVVEAWRDHQVEVKLARGYEGAVAGNVSKAWIWIPLCVLFVLPFFDPRRPFRLLHLDLLVLLSFSISLLFFNEGEIVWSVPLVYPALAYVFARMLIAGFRPRARPGALVPWLPVRWLLIAGTALLVFRIVLNVVDSQVIDIGFANVVGADRIASGEGVYDGAFTPLIDRGDSYGPLSYIAYVPFELLFPWHGGLEELPAAHAAAIFFDLIVVALLYAAGRRLRDGRDGRDLGIALAFAWLAYPFTLYALDANGGNDALVAALLVAALLAFASPMRRGLAIALASAVKFGPLALAPLFAAGGGERRLRSTAIFTAALAAVAAVTLLPLLPDGGFRELYDRTLGYQASRGSPFSVWGLEPSLGRIQDLARAFAVVLGLALFLVPRRRTVLQAAALGAAVLIATQVGSTHWFYFFILWWAPYVLVNAFATQERIVAPSTGPAGRG